MITVEESGMTFGPFVEKDFFHIEKSDVYQEIENNVKIVEFVLHKQKGDIGQIWLIEAKKSSPHPGNPKDWDDFLTEIMEKFDNGLCLVIALCINRHADPDFKESLRNVNLANVQFQLTLVIKGHKTEWLPPLKDALQQKLIPLCKSLNLGANPVLVLNDSMALEKGLITQFV